jgi:hypothetical protein
VAIRTSAFCATSCRCSIEKRLVFDVIPWSRPGTHGAYLATMAHPHAHIFSASVIVLSLVACGGKLSNAPSEFSDANDVGRNDNDTEGAAPNVEPRGGGDGSATESCVTSLVPCEKACVPGTARANTPLDVQIAGSSSSCISGCFASLESCEVSVAGTSILLSLSERSCSPQASDQRICALECILPSARCRIPALAAGTYTVTVAGEARISGLAPRTLVVADTPLATSSCSLGLLPPPPLDDTKYPTACASDADCALATVGDLCKICACPNAAIAKSALETYQSDARARRSQCATRDIEAFPCAGCRRATPTCERAPGASKGACKLRDAGVNFRE